MDKLEIEDPVLLDTFETDARGRINFGENYADSTVRVCLISVGDSDDNQ